PRREDGLRVRLGDGDPRRPGPSDWLAAAGRQPAPPRAGPGAAGLQQFLRIPRTARQRPRRLARRAPRVLRRHLAARRERRRGEARRAAEGAPGGGARPARVRSRGPR
ncbi:unnamed protein product, partial [Prorocentrum cordatum]